MKRNNYKIKFLKKKFNNRRLDIKEGNTIIKSLLISYNLLSINKILIIEKFIQN